MGFVSPVSSQVGWRYFMRCFSPGRIQIRDFFYFEVNDLVESKLNQNQYDFLGLTYCLPMVASIREAKKSTSLITYNKDSFDINWVDLTAHKLNAFVHNLLSSHILR